MKNNSGAITKLTAAMAIFGTIGLFVRAISLPSGEIALYRAVLATVFIGLYLLITKNRIQFSKIKRMLPILLVSGIAMGLNWVLLFEAYNYTSVSVATLSYYFAPVIVTAICPLLFKEKTGLKGVICFVMSTLGIVLITGLGDLSEGSDHIKGILLGLGAAVLYATVIILNKFLKDIDNIHRTFLQFVSSITVLLPYVLATDGINLTGLDIKGTVCLLTVGLVHTGVTYCLYFSSLVKMSGQKVSILSYIDPLVAVILSWTVLGESMTPTQIAGGALILGFTLINEIEIKKK